MRCVIQAGHINIQYNVDTLLRSSTGAPGEQEFTLRVANRLSELLRARGIEVKQTDANANSDNDITSKDWDLFLAIHYDADVYGTGGGFIDIPDPSVDAAHNRSVELQNALQSVYFDNTGIVNHPERSNVNTKYYYMWRSLSAKTPCVIIECGVGQDAHDKVILADTDRVCNAICRGICKAFGISFDTVTTFPPNTSVTDTSNYLKRIKDIAYGKGFVYQKLARIKEILAEAKI